MLKVVIVGYGEMFTNLIAGALDSNCKIVGVLRKEVCKHNWLTRKIKDIINPSIEYNYIKSYNLPEINVKSVNSKEFRKILLKLNPDIILVGSWFEKFEKETFRIPKIATINAHPSLLPKYRGPNPYFWTIKNGETKSGITLHLIDERYDTGAILAQEEVEIKPDDTGETLKKRTVLTARFVARALLNSLGEDIIIPLQQREDKSSYYSHPEGLELDFTKSAEENYNTIRAIHPWGKCWFYHKSNPIAPNPETTSIINNYTEYQEAGTIVDIEYNTNTVSILCSDNKILKMGNIKHYSNLDKIFTSNYIKRDMNIGDIIN